MYPLKRWCNQDCLQLAVSANNEEFIAHDSCQNVISKKWSGGLMFQGSTPRYQV